MSKLTFFFALVAAFLILSGSAYPAEDAEDASEIGERVERGFFCNPAICYRNCRLSNHRRGSCSGDECICI